MDNNIIIIIMEKTLISRAREKKIEVKKISIDTSLRYGATSTSFHITSIYVYTLSYIMMCYIQHTCDVLTSHSAM